MSRHKYHAQPTVIDGIRFASKAEARRFRELKLLEQAGEIRELELQPRYPLYAPARGGGQEKVGTYCGDFAYRQGPRGVLVVEDVKGMDLPLSKWKRKHVLLQYGIEVQVIRA